MTDKFITLFGIPKKKEEIIEKDIEENENEESSMLKTIKSSLTESVEVEKNYTYFFIVFAVGLLFKITSPIKQFVCILESSNVLSALFVSTLNV